MAAELDATSWTASKTLHTGMLALTALLVSRISGSYFDPLAADGTEISVQIPGKTPVKIGGFEFKARVGKLCPLLTFVICTLLGTYPSTNSLRTKFSDRPDVTFRLRVIATVPCEPTRGSFANNQKQPCPSAYSKGNSGTNQP